MKFLFGGNAKREDGSRRTKWSYAKRKSVNRRRNKAARAARRKNRR